VSPAAMSNAFGKSRRLRRRGEFQKVFDTGQRMRGRFLTLLMARTAEAKGPRLGIVASRKLGDSVRRNRAKRLIREVFRQNLDPAHGNLDIVVIPRSELFDATYASLENDYRTVFARCAARLEKRECG
jgi:ribonuclease P protein component